MPTRRNDTNDQITIDAAMKPILDIGNMYINYKSKLDHFGKDNDTAKAILTNIIAQELDEESKKDAIKMAQVGLIVMCLAHHNYVMTPSDRVTIDGNEKNYYPFSYKKLCYETELDTQSDEFKKKKPEEQLQVTALKIGQKIVNRDLPFDPNTLKAIFKLYTNQWDTITRLNKWVDIIQAMRDNDSYYEVSQGLLSAYDKPSNYGNISIEFYNSNATLWQVQNTDTIRESIIQLKRETLNNFLAQKYNFDYSSCMELAKQVHTIADKIYKNNLTQKDIKTFEEATKKYQSSHEAKIRIQTIIGVLAGFVIGAVVGLGIGAIPGAVVGGFIANKRATLFYKKEDEKNPINKFKNEAEKFITKNPASTNVEPLLSEEDPNYTQFIPVRQSNN